jgi:AcrR family transcriptional regulator
MILVMEKSILAGENTAAAGRAGTADVVARIAAATLAGKGADYAAEVRRLLDAGREVMARCGTTSRPRVADIVAAAGLSNDAFYRHFSSKDQLVAAILADGSERLCSYLAHQMAKADSPDGAVRAWVEGVLAQAADDDVAATTLAVMWNGGSVSETLGAGRPSIAAPLATLLREPFAALGSTEPDLDASMAAHAVVGRLSDHLWQGTKPTAGEVDRVVAFCVAAVSP